MNDSLNPLVGCTSLHPWDSPVTHNLVRSLNPTYVRSSIAYALWYNDGSNPNWAGVDGPAYYDKLHELNSMYKIILCLDDVPFDKIESFVPMILSRYNVWAITPVNEDEDATRTANRIKEFNRVIPEARLIGPDLQNDYSPWYLNALSASGALGCIDTLGMHDYIAVPGNGLVPLPPWDNMIYAHPDQIDTYHGFPNLTGRINWMKSYIPHLRKKFTDGPKVMLSEYGSFVNDVNDSILAAKISKATNVPMIFCAPNGPAGHPTSYPYSHGIYSADLSSARWSDAMTAYLKEINTPEPVVVPIVNGRKLPLQWWQKILRIFGFYKK